MTTHLFYNNGLDDHFTDPEDRQAITGNPADRGACTVLELREIAGVKRYASGEATPKWADLISQVLSFGTVIPMILAGIIVWIKQKNPHLFLSGFLMFAFSALGPATGNTDLIFFISMFGELLMVFFLWLCARKTART